MTDLPDLVVGSGPAGVSVALALLSRGRRVLMLDGGQALEPEAEARRDRLAALPALTEADREAWRAGQYQGRAGQVRRFGSDFAMEPPEATFAETGGLALRASRAVGGLSNLWGSAVLPYHPGDLVGWPIGIADLAPHYRALAEVVPISAGTDDLATLFAEPPVAGQASVAPSRQGAALLNRLAARRAALAAAGVTVGAARVAVSAGCRRCGLCLQGCPYGMIWSAAHLLPRLRAQGLTHRTGIVTRFVETADGVELFLQGGERVAGARLYLGAGVLETARILLASGLPGREVTLLDSQQAFLPMLHPWRPGPVDRPPFHTLPQVFAELDARDVSPRLVHAQIYSWNEYYLRDLMANYGRKLPGSRPLWAAMARRLMVAQLFLHSDHSARIGLRLAADGRLVAERRSPADGATMARALAAMARAMRLGGLFPLSFAARQGAPGASFHVGGTVPMAASPGVGQSDRLGRPYGLNAVHLVDASVFPSVPATTITYSVMANAHRIGSAA